MKVRLFKSPNINKLNYTYIIKDLHYLELQYPHLKIRISFEVILVIFTNIISYSVK